MKIKRLPFLIIGIILLLTFLTMAIFPQFFTSYNQKYSFEPWLPPSFSHILPFSFLNLNCPGLYLLLSGIIPLHKEYKGYTGKADG